MIFTNGLYFLTTMYPKDTNQPSNLDLEHLNFPKTILESKANSTWKSICKERNRMNIEVITVIYVTHYSFSKKDREIPGVSGTRCQVYKCLLHCFLIYLRYFLIILDLKITFSYLLKYYLYFSKLRKWQRPVDLGFVFDV